MTKEKRPISADAFSTFSEIFERVDPFFTFHSGPFDYETSDEIAGCFIEKENGGIVVRIDALKPEWAGQKFLLRFRFAGKDEQKEVTLQLVSGGKEAAAEIVFSPEEYGRHIKDLQELLPKSGLSPFVVTQIEEKKEKADEGKGEERSAWVPDLLNKPQESAASRVESDRERKRGWVSEH